VTGLGGRFWRLYASSATSNLADGIGRIALPLLATHYTRSPVLIAGLSSLAFVPWLLFALPSGALVDRVDRRYAMAAANGLRAAAALTLGVLAAVGEANIAVLYAVAFALGLAETVYDSAIRAILPQVVGSERLDSANGLLTVEETLGQTFLGSPLGSWLLAVSVSVPFLLNGSGFAIAALLVLSLRGNYKPARAAARTSIRRDVAEGVRWLRGHAFLRALTLVSAATGFLQSMTTGVLVLYVLEVLHVPQASVGLILIAAGAGALVGGIGTPLLARRLRKGPMLVVGAVVSAVGIGAMGLTGNAFVAGTLFALSGAGVMVWNVLTMSLRQALIPHELFGRVQGAYRTLVWGAIPLGSLAGGFLGHAAGLPAVFLGAGAGLLLMAIVLGRVVRTHRDQLTIEPPSLEEAAAEAPPAATPVA
jgi:MFS family permease